MYLGVWGLHPDGIQSNRVHSYDKNTKVAIVHCTPQPDISRGSNSFDKDSFRTIGLPWQPYALGVYGYALAA